jgi:shikimate kinase
LGEAKEPPPHLALVGFMGVGKTTTGNVLAGRLGWPLRDSDVDLRERTGMSGAEIAARHGVDTLHRLEEEVLLDALASPSRTVITAAGSAVASERCRQGLTERATVVWLDAPVDDVVARMAGNNHRRPIARREAEALLARRRDHLAAVSDLRLDTREPTAALVDRILEVVADLGTGDPQGQERG